MIRFATRFVLPVMVACLFTLAAVGCAGLNLSSQRTGKLTVDSISHPQTQLVGNFTRSIYSYDGKNTLTVVLLEEAGETLQQAVTLRMFWQPRVGRTPLDETATNVTVQYIIFAGSDGQASPEVGVYSGAGFMYPRNSPGGKHLSAGLWQANLHLADRSAAFADLLGKAVLEGEFTATRDDLAVQQTIRELESKVSQSLGYPRLVQQPRRGRQG